MTRVFQSAKDIKEETKKVNKIMDEIEAMCYIGDKNILKIHETKERLKTIGSTINEKSFLCLLELLEDNNKVVQSCINEEFVLNFLKYLFDFSHKQYFQDSVCSIRYRHWVYKFHADKTITAYNDFRNINYVYPSDVINERTTTPEYKFLYYGNKFFKHKISLKTYLSKMCPDKSFISGFLWFVKNYRKYNKKYFVNEFNEYNQTTDNMIVQAKVNMQDLVIQKEDYYLSANQLIRRLPNFNIIIDNQEFSKKIIDSK